MAVLNVGDLASLDANVTEFNAVALAGGYTPRANHDRIKIKHSNESTEQEKEVKEDSAVLPGDVIEVPERFF